MITPFSSLELKFSLHQRERFRAKAPVEWWFVSSRRGEPLLSHPPFSTSFPLLRSLFPKPPMTLWSGEVDSVEIQIPDHDRLLRELRAMRMLLRGQASQLPQRFVFAPAVESEALPLYSQRRLRTGNMDAGIGFCWINRNWDGLDRVEDLTLRDSFDDVHGEIRILRFSLWEWMRKDLNRWIHWLEQAGADLKLSLTRDLHEAQGALNPHLILAEQGRTRLGLPGYRWQDLEKAETLCSQQLQHATEDDPAMLEQVASYTLEVFRARWGGHFRASSKPGLLLALPFGSTVQMLPRFQKARQSRKPIRLMLQAEVLKAHERQGALLEQMTWEAEQPEMLRRKAAIRILSEIADARVEQFFIHRLTLETEPDLLMRLLDRLYRSALRVADESLEPLIRHSHDGVSARALLLLNRRNPEAVPEWIREELKGAQRLALRPLARYLLEKVATPRARKVLRDLGPIPLLAPGESMLPSSPYPSGDLSLTAEILEDTRNPTRQQQAIRLFSLFPDQEERETYGEALADPDPSVRRAAIGILVGSDRPMAIELLRGRAMFEQDPSLKKWVQEAMQVQLSKL